LIFNQLTKSSIVENESTMKFNSGENRAFTTAFTLLIAAVSLLLVWTTTLGNPKSLNWNQWAFYEWLINYQAGFVRRGLSGEILLRFFYGREIEAINHLVFYLGAAYILFSASQALQLKYSAKNALLYVFAPTGFFSIAVSNEHFYRKEILFYCAILGIAAIYRIWSGAPRKCLAWSIGISIALFSLIFPPVHEAYIFYCTLIFSVILYKVFTYYIGKEKTKRIVVAYVILNALIFLVLSRFKGEVFQAEGIWRSLSPSARTFSPTGVIAGGISAIGWSSFQGVTLPIKALLSGTGVYYIFPLAMVYIIVAFIKSGMDGVRFFDVSGSPNFLGNFLLVFATFVPLFVLGWDWGRWSLGVFIVFSTMAFSGLLVDLNFTASAKYSFMHLLGPREAIFILLISISFFARTPECCIAGSGDSFLTNKLKSIILENWRSLPAPVVPLANH
jgi:hypothetical protein